MHRYATIGAILMSKKVVDGIRDKGGFWKHGHTYQVGLSLASPPNFLTRAIGASDRLRCIFGRSKSDQDRWVVRAVSVSRRTSPFSVDETAAGTELCHRAGDIRHSRRRVRSRFSLVVELFKTPRQIVLGRRVRF